MPELLFLARPPVLRIRPSDMTAVRPKTLLRIVPYLICTHVRFSGMACVSVVWRVCQWHGVCVSGMACVSVVWRVCQWYGVRVVMGSVAHVQWVSYRSYTNATLDSGVAKIHTDVRTSAGFVTNIDR